MLANVIREKCLLLPTQATGMTSEDIRTLREHYIIPFVTRPSGLHRVTRERILLSTRSFLHCMYTHAYLLTYVQNRLIYTLNPVNAGCEVEI